MTNKVNPTIEAVFGRSKAKAGEEPVTQRNSRNRVADSSNTGAVNAHSPAYGEHLKGKRKK